MHGVSLENYKPLFLTAGKLWKQQNVSNLKFEHPRLKDWNNSASAIYFVNQLSSELKGFVNWME